MQVYFDVQIGDDAPKRVTIGLFGDVARGLSPPAHPGPGYTVRALIGRARLQGRLGAGPFSTTHVVTVDVVELLKSCRGAPRLWAIPSASEVSKGPSRCHQPSSPKAPPCDVRCTLERLSVSV